MSKNTIQSGLASSSSTPVKKTTRKSIRARATQAEADEINRTFAAYHETPMPQRVESADLLTFDFLDDEQSMGYFKNIDRKIQYFYLSGGRQLKDELDKSHRVKCTSADGRYFLAAEKNISLQTSQVMSLKRATAASSLALFKSLNVGDGDMIKRVEPAHVQLLKYGSETIKSSLSIAHSIDETYYIHYLYHIGTDYLVKYFPTAVIGILIWRLANRKEIFNLETEDNPAKDLRTASVYLNTLPGGFDHFIAANTLSIKNVLTLLAKIAPEVVGGREAMATSQCKKMKELLSFYKEQVKSSPKEPLRI